MAVTTTRKTLRQEVARSLGCMITTQVDTNYTAPSTTLSLGALVNFAQDNQKFQYWYVQRADGAWRLITSTTIGSNGDVALASTFADGTGLQSGDNVDLYMVLDPDAWNFCIDEGLKDEFRKVSTLIPLESGVNEYDLSAAIPWLQLRGQLIRMRYRNSETHNEEDIPVLYTIENDYGLTLKIPYVPSAFDQIRVEAKRYYEALAADTDTVTLPSGLAKARIRYRALQQIFQTVGPGAKQYWGQAMVLAERDLHFQEERWKQNEAQYRDWSVEDEPLFADPEGAHSWSW